MQSTTAVTTSSAGRRAQPARGIADIVDDRHQQLLPFLVTVPAAVDGEQLASAPRHVAEFLLGAAARLALRHAQPHQLRRPRLQVESDLLVDIGAQRSPGAQVQYAPQAGDAHLALHAASGSVERRMRNTASA